ncbi:hypothetical protein MWN33_15430 [Starkeya koreensis]|uniref:CopC domain-containing protein n=1 Tax=Ancylobacter koreensis TaxID=266121 RepID=A0ABT0DQ61_9HYPH|nr:hypothetical protein [Ancylobacter koreensis]MCK0209425.1 hypothetical protein [Ancylobacter koreensis]
MARQTIGRIAGVAAAFVLAALFLLAPAPAQAQDGHNHGAVARTISVAPRTEARIGNQEAVLAYDRNKLVLFLQRYSDGQPTTGAEIGVTIDFVPVTFEEVAPGTYVASDVMLAAGRNELEVSYKIGEREGTDTLILNLPQGSSATGAAASTRAPGAAVSGLLLAAIALAIYAGTTALLAARSRTA